LYEYDMTVFHYGLNFILDCMILISELNFDSGLILN
jgi:hypothetical protein